MVRSLPPLTAWSSFTHRENMSHLWTHGRTVFVGNSDLSGSIRIINELGERINVPGRDLIDFVVGHIKRERISELEHEDTASFVGIRHLPDAAPLEDREREGR